MLSWFEEVSVVSWAVWSSTPCLRLAYDRVSAGFDCFPDMSGPVYVFPAFIAAVVLGHYLDLSTPFPSTGAGCTGGLGGHQEGPPRHAGRLAFSAAARRVPRRRGVGQCDWRAGRNRLHRRSHCLSRTRSVSRPRRHHLRRLRRCPDRGTRPATRAGGPGRAFRRAKPRAAATRRRPQAARISGRSCG